jgi:hypothetical protein
MYKMGTKNHINALPGSCDDDALVRGLITDGIKKSHKSREQIADEMSALTGQKISTRMLNAFTAEAMERHRFPFCWARAFCLAVNDWLLIKFIASRAGFELIDSKDRQVLEVGRAYLSRRKIEARMGELERQIGEEETR